MKNKFYFTFGTSPSFPFHKGWVKVMAEDLNDAVSVFNSYYPPRTASGCVNCSFMYNEQEFKRTSMYTDRGSWGHCHRTLTVHRDKASKMEDILDAMDKSEDLALAEYQRDLIEGILQDVL